MSENGSIRKANALLLLTPARSKISSFVKELSADGSETIIVVATKEQTGGGCEEEEEGTAVRKKEKVTSLTRAKALAFSVE